MSTDSPQTIQGVRINCKGDIDVLKAKKFVPVLVDRSAPMFTETIIIHGDELADQAVSCRPISRFSELVGTPIEVRKIAPDASWKDADVCGHYVNQEATFLLISMNLKSAYLNLAPMIWQDNVGSVLVTRVNGEAISAQQIEALCAYNKQILEAMQKAVEWDDGHNDFNGVPDEPGERGKVLDGVTPGAFQTFFKKFKGEKLAEDPTWEDKIAPVLMKSRESAWGPYVKNAEFYVE